MSAIKDTDLLADDSAIQISWDDGTLARFHAVWLRDHAQDNQTRSPANGQRLVTILELPENVSIGAVRQQDSQLEVTFMPEDKTVAFHSDWLRANRYDTGAPKAAGWTPDTVTSWDADDLGRMPTTDYAAAAADSRILKDWLAGIHRFGVARMTGMPLESGSVCKVVDLFGFVRETNYGRFFEVRTEINPVNLAYTGLGLQVHTDNPYRDPVPTLQLLSCLENSADGGDSVVVDGFKAAKLLRQEAPESFALLANQPARFTYTGRGDVHLSAKQPLIELGPDGELLSVRFNNRSMGPLTDIPYDVMADYYAAYRRLAEIMERPQLAATFRLHPGELFIVDNTRVLHGRTGYSGSGSRWLQGSYADKDGLLSTLLADDDTATQEAVA